MIEQSEGDEAHKEHEYEKLRQMQAYTSAETCLQRYILQYFGDEGEDCKNVVIVLMKESFSILQLMLKKSYLVSSEWVNVLVRRP